MLIVNYVFAVVVGQLVEGLIPIPEIYSSNPTISKFLYTVNCTERRKRGREWLI